MAPNITWTVRLTVKVTAAGFDDYGKRSHHGGYA
jgi:hypothetical protein